MTKKNLLPDLSEEQQDALELLQSGENVFLTGGAGSGKSFLIRHFMSGLNAKDFPILASTGAAAVLLGGRTFHSFFGLGIMEGGREATLQRIMTNAKLLRRIERVEGIVIDEVSMIPGVAFSLAEEVARIARGSTLPWGGLRVIVVGDFAQLPPITRDSQRRDWSFQTSIWEESGFQIRLLKHNQRVKDASFLDVLADVREGRVTTLVQEYLESRMRVHDENDKSTRLFPRRDQSETHNQRELALIPFPETRIDSIYIGEERYVESLKKNSPVPNQIVLKKEARVMFVQNDPNRRWVNGTRGWVREITTDKITVEKDSGREVTVEKTSFSLLDAEGKNVASVINFPLILAYATTIHKSQGATLDELWVDLRRLWEPGHAYVAMSRLQYGDGLRLLGWTVQSFKTDPAVQAFYSKLNF